MQACSLDGGLLLSSCRSPLGMIRPLSLDTTETQKASRRLAAMGTRERGLGEGIGWKGGGFFAQMAESG